MTPILEHHVLKADIAGIAQRAGVTLSIEEQTEPTVSGRRIRARVYTATLPRELGFAARFVREGWLERAKKHFVDEVEVGSAMFDDAIFVVTSSHEATRAYLAQPRVQAALLLLVDATRCVEAHDNRIRVVDEDAPDTGLDAQAELLALALCALGVTPTLTSSARTP